MQLSLLHPRLFHALALFEPIIQDDQPPGPNAAVPPTFRPDLWPSRDAAATSFRRNRMFSAWDARVLNIYIKYGLREIPTSLYAAVASPENTPGLPSAQPGSVTLTTSKHQEAWSYVRPNFIPRATSDPSGAHQERLLSPDLDPATQGTYLFRRAETIFTNMQLPHLRPRVFWIFGERSPVNTQALQVDKLSRTGTGVGGSGGAQLGKVERMVVPGTAHLVMFEEVSITANILAWWLRAQKRTFEDDEEFYRRQDSGKSKDGMLRMSDQWLKNVRLPGDAKRPAKAKL